MSKVRLLTLLLALAAAPLASAAEPEATGQEAPAKVIIVGLFHLANPGRDMFNVQVDDVLAAGRQAELERIAAGLARFEPTRVMVEWPRARTDEQYAAYRDGTLAPSANEVVQLGFRLADRMELPRVEGIEVGGDFPFGPVQAFGAAHGREAQLEAALAQVGEHVQAINARLAEGSLGAALRYVNEPGRALHHHGFYIDLLRFGDGEDQPGAALASAWYARNLGICARLLQSLSPGDRGVVFYGEGHAHLLRQCIVEAPGVELVEANDYLVE
ncbi:MAG: DUF5694 domain-containing protein [Pseudomonadota bacterium]|nr:DUF5694 domain-containing protein [Pseudomonadota bacterium]